ncbi:MAG: glycosyl transferase [Armatimonadaceae bacterium]
MPQHLDKKQTPLQSPGVSPTTTGRGTPSLPATPERYPEAVRYPIRLDYLHTMTDDTGLIQHGIGGIPDLATGYTTDDNVRAFLAMVRLWRALPDQRGDFEPLMRRYLAFVTWTQKRDGEKTGFFTNFVSYDRRFLDEWGTEDCLGRCIWALGEAVSGNLPTGCALAVRMLYNRAVPRLFRVHSPRALAYALLGLTHTPRQNREVMRYCADVLLDVYRTYSHENWRWFEPYLTYDNARMVEAMWRVGAVLEDDECRAVAQETHAFLTQHSFGSDGLEPIGNRGWWKEGQEKALFDQQTLEAGAYTELYHLTGDPERARLALEWFYGRNAHRLPIYDPDTGACYDSLTMEGENLNQGAESVLSYLLAVATLMLPPSKKSDSVR